MKTTRQLEGGRVWTHKNNPKREVWSSDCHNYEIIRLDNGRWRLVAFEHTTDDGDFVTRDFQVIEDAMRAAELM